MNSLKDSEKTNEFNNKVKKIKKMKNYKSKIITPEKYIITTQKNRIYTIKVSIDGYYNQIQIDCPRLDCVIKGTKQYHKTINKIWRKINKVFTKFDRKFKK